MDVIPKTTTKSPGWESIGLGLTDGSKMLSRWLVPRFSVSGSGSSGLGGVELGSAGVPDGVCNMA